MTDAVDTVIQDWAIPRMQVQKIVCGAFTGNPASVRVFEKNGFKTKSIIEGAVEVRGRKRGIHIMEWLVAPLEADGH
jgi:RimJ/RimL family protein N-acetyltransferase